NDALSSAGGLVPGVLVRSAPGARDPAKPTSGRGGTQSTHTFQGFFENLTVARREGTTVRQAGKYVSLLGASIAPPLEPQPGDEITIEGRTVSVLEVTERDPAAALYVVLV